MKILLFLTILFSLTASIKFNFEVQGNKQHCFRENLPINTHVVGEVMLTSSLIPNFRLIVTDEKRYTILDKKLDPEHFHRELAALKEEKRKAHPEFVETQIEELIYQENRADLCRIKYAFSTQVTGVTTVCLSNIDTINNSYDFELNHGIDAKDYTNIAKKQNLKPAETDILMVEDFVKEMKATAESIWVKESHKLEISEAFNSNLVWASFFGIIVIVAFAGFEYFVIKSYFKQKKLI